jgi:hypothetical protein
MSKQSLNALYCLKKNQSKRKQSTNKYVLLKNNKVNMLKSTTIVKPALVVTSLKQLPVLKGHLGTIVIVW